MTRSRKPAANPTPSSALPPSDPPPPVQLPPPTQAGPEPQPSTRATLELPPALAALFRIPTPPTLEFRHHPIPTPVVETPLPLPSILLEGDYPQSIAERCLPPSDALVEPSPGPLNPEAADIAVVPEPCSDSVSPVVAPAAEPWIDTTPAGFPITDEPSPAPLESPAILPPPPISLWLDARDPFSLVAHWSAEFAALDSWLASISADRLRLRVHAHRRDGVLMTDQVVTRDVHHRVVPVLYAGTRYVAELGYANAEGRWRSLAVAEPVATPADTHRGEWSERRHRFDLLAMAPPPPLPAQPAVTPPQATPSPATSSTPAPTLAPAESVAVLGDGPDESQELGEFPDDAGAILLARLVWEPEPVRVSAGNSAELTEFGGRLVTLPHVQAVKPRPAPSSPGLAVPSAVPSAGERPPSSADIPPGPGPGDFWFKVNAELILYGSTEPTASVTIAGRPVSLRDDGSFSFRFSLPDGAYSLPAIATKADGSDQRTAELSFQRATHYRGTVGVHPQDPALKPPVAESIHEPGA